MAFQQTLEKLQPSRFDVSDETRQKHDDAMERAKGYEKDDEASVIINGEIRAKWKIEVTFLRNRSAKGLNAYGVRVWESGRGLNGEGDVLAFWCLDADQNSNAGCRTIIAADQIEAGVAVCPGCKRAIKAEALTDMVGGNVYMDNLAKYLAAMFRKLNSSADIYIKFHKDDIRYIAMAKSKGLAKAEKLKGLHIYPLKNIIKDTANGADLTNRIKAFLTA